MLHKEEQLITVCIKKAVSMKRVVNLGVRH